MKKLLVAALGGTAVASLAFASASVLAVDGGTIQAGTDGGLYCDADGVKANWGLETDDNSVRSVRISGIAAECAGADMFVKTNTMDRAVMVTLTNSGSATVSLPAGTTPESLESIKIWIEG